MKPMLAAVAALLALGACTERDMCLGRIGSQLRTLEGLAATTQGNIDRGYAIAESQRVVERRYVCVVEQPDGSSIQQICTDIETITDSTPMAIDLNAERAKLRSLQERIAQERRRVDAARAQCNAAYPS